VQFGFGGRSDFVEHEPERPDQKSVEDEHA
jgi:hypothetical protein